VTCLEEGLEDALAVLALPEKYRRRLKSTNMQERLIQEIRRRERVIRIRNRPIASSAPWWRRSTRSGKADATWT